MLPATSSFSLGVAVPIPTLPLPNILAFSELPAKKIISSFEDVPVLKTISSNAYKSICLPYKTVVFVEVPFAGDVEALYNLFSAFPLKEIVPLTSNAEIGLLVPIPTLLLDKSMFKLLALTPTFAPKDSLLFSEEI